MTESVGEERKDWELKRESELRLEVDENQQVVIRVSEGAPGGKDEVEMFVAHESSFCCVIALCKLTATQRIAAVPVTSCFRVGATGLTCYAVSTFIQFHPLISLPPSLPSPSLPSPPLPSPPPFCP